MRIFQCLSIALLILHVNGASVFAQEDLTPLYTLSGGEAGPSSLTLWLAMSAEFNARLLEIVFWALGTVVTLVVVVLGVNWFTGARSYQRDKEAMELQLSVLVERGLNSIRAELVADFEKRIETHIQSLESEKRSITELGAGLREETREALAAVEPRVVSAVREAVGPVQEELTSLTKDMRGRFERASDWTSYRLASLEYDLNVQDARMWAGTPRVPANALAAHLRAIETAIKNKLDRMLSFQLDAIVSLLSSMNTLDADYVESINKVLGLLPSEFDTTGQRIRELMKHKHT